MPLQVFGKGNIKPKNRIYLEAANTVSQIVYHMLLKKSSESDASRNVHSRFAVRRAVSAAWSPELSQICSAVSSEHR